jgi:predicted transcriptional regulator
MNIHQRAALTPLRRGQMVAAVREQGLSRKDAAAAFPVSPRTVAKWLARHRAGGVAALTDRSSRPKRLHRPTPLLRQEEVIALRRHKLTGSPIALRTGLSRATVSRIVRPSHRVTGDRRDTVKGHGWEYVFVAIDDHSRVAHAAILSSSKDQFRFTPL